MRFLSIIFIIFLSGCEQPSLDDTVSTKQSGDANLSFKYQCKSGQTIKVSYPTDSTAVVDYDERRFQMKIAVSGSGARYVGNGLEWWTKGTGKGASGVLLRHLKDGTSGKTIEHCTQVADKTKD